MKFRNPKEKLVTNLTALLQNAGLWREELLKEIPSSWEKCNNYIIFSDNYFKSKEWYEVESAVWEEVCRIFSVGNVALKGRIQGDGYRSPKVNILWGSSKQVEYTDNKVLYTWDVERSMFCAGNASERHRIAKLDCTDEIIVDLFTGIGYFTLPLLVHTKCRHVYACEWNPSAVAMLKNNLEKNGVADRCTIYEGDNRLVTISNLADRVLLGLIPSSRDWWNIACCALNMDKGGVLHIHENVTSKVTTKGIPSSSNSCDKCLYYLGELGLSVTEDKLSLSFEISLVKEQQVGLAFIVEKVSKNCIWKRPEWFLWALHASHIILDMLNNVKPTGWRTVVKNLHQVKSYAPHIDHLVLDLDCRPFS